MDHCYGRASGRNRRLGQKVHRKLKSVFSETIIRLLGYKSNLTYWLIGCTFLKRGRLRQSKKALEKEFQTDIVSGAITRRFGEKLLDEQFGKARANCNPTAVMMFDLDDFKNINDKYGHGMGDLVLREIVSTLAQVTRSSDRIVRWGGDEFVIMLPGLSVENVKSFGEKALGAYRH
jgi:GGDEF domain-containing protein